MQIGLVISIIAAVIFALAHVLVKKGVADLGEAFTSVAVNAFGGAILFAAALLYAGEWDKVWALSWHGWLMLGAGGIMHFVAGRLLVFKSIRLIGANKSGAISGTALVYAVILGVIVLQESFTAYLGIGAACIALGTIMVSVSKEESTSKLHGKGVLAALLGSIFWGSSGILIKPVIEEMGSALAATFVSYLVAALAIAAMLIGREQRAQLARLPRYPLVYFGISAAFFSLGQYLRYLAFDYSPVSVVTPLMATYALFTFFFSFFINRKIEVFTWKVFVGLVATVGGAFLLFL